MSPLPETRRWTALLAAHRQPWPEWAALESRVRSSGFLVQSHPHAELAFLVEDPPMEGFRLIRRVPDEAPKALPPAFPAFLPAIEDLVLHPGNVPAERGLLVSGGLAGLASDGVVEVDPTDPDTVLATQPQLFNYEDPGGVTFPEARLYLLQSGPGGEVFCCDDTGLVRAYSPEAATFLPVGPTVAFLRWSLGELVAGRPWFESWLEARGLAERGLTTVAMY